MSTELEVKNLIDTVQNRYLIYADFEQQSAIAVKKQRHSRA